MEFVIAKRAGRYAVVRELPSGEAAGYDARADRNGSQVHFRIYCGTPTQSPIDRAFADPLTRKYLTADEAVADAEESGRSVGKAYC